VEFKDIVHEKRNGRAYIRFNRPERLNALTLRMGSELTTALCEADRDPDVRVIVVTGEGKAFCAGADLGEMIPLVTGGDPRAYEVIAGVMLKHRMIRKPIIAAVNGDCLAGGTEFLQATDIRIASGRARFGLPEPRWGIVPAGGSHVRLPRQIPYCWAMEIMLTGELISAEKALQVGLINNVVPHEKLMDTVEEYARIICEKAPLAVQKIKEITLRCLSLPMEEAFYLEEAAAREVMGSKDAKEGPRAFIEKRKPVFEGR